MSSCTTLPKKLLSLFANLVERVFENGYSLVDILQFVEAKQSKSECGWCCKRLPRFIDLERHTASDLNSLSLELAGNACIFVITVVNDNYSGRFAFLRSDILEPKI